MPRRRHAVFPALTAAVLIPPAVLIAATPIAAQVTVTDSGGAAARYVANPGAPRTTLVSRLAAAQPQVLPPGVGSERGLQIRTILAERAISARFPQIREIGGARADALPWHPNGLAIDVIIPAYETPAGRALGDRIMAFAFDNAERFGLVHVIWQQTYYPARGVPHRMADLGSDDANHFTHVHIATDGGGYPAS